MLVGLVLGTVGFVLFFIGLWTHPPRSPIVPSIVYLVLAAAAVAFAATFFAAVGTGVFFAILTAFDLPGLILAAMLGPMTDVDVAVPVIIAGLLLNAALIYGAGAFAKKRFDEKMKFHRNRLVVPPSSDPGSVPQGRHRDL